MQFFPLLLSSVLSFVDIFYQENIAKDIEQTFFSESSTINVDNYFIPSTRTNQVFDFIVVGGGSAGSIVAKRLAEDGRFQVGLFEIGGEPMPQSFVPSLIGGYIGSPYTSFNYKTTLQPSSGEYQIVIGKSLGGTGILNSMIFSRGSPFDYDNWANITGDDTWTYKNLLDYFKKMENYQGEFPNEEHHGVDGPMTISPLHYVPGQETFLRAGTELGFPIADPNGPQKPSFCPFEYNKKNGRRDSSYATYIGDKDSVPNLTVITYANVTEITFDESKRATGIVYMKHGVTFIAKANNQVIVSAGTYGSPQLLLRSGVGPADHLAELNIPLVSDVPTGHNLQDHIYVPLKFTLEDPSMIHDDSLNITEASANEYLENGTGPFASAFSENGQAFIVSTHAVSEGYPEWPDIQFLSHARSVYIPYFADGDEQKSVFVTPQVGRVKSQGTIKLNIDNIHLDPIINFNMMSDSQNRDRQVLIEAIRWCLRVFEETPAYAEVGAMFTKPNLPECDQFEYRSDEYWSCFIDQALQPGNHPSGTCRMGGQDDPASVVDSKLRVLGVSGLRVIDASVMPIATNANLQTAVFLIAEKGTADVLADQGSLFTGQNKLLAG